MGDGCPIILLCQALSWLYSAHRVKTQLQKGVLHLERQQLGVCVHPQAMEVGEGKAAHALAPHWCWGCEMGLYLLAAVGLPWCIASGMVFRKKHKTW